MKGLYRKKFLKQLYKLPHDIRGKMARFTLRIPDSLHRKLSEQAQKEGVSLNQYILLSLSRAVTEEDNESQRTQFEAMRHRYSERDSEATLQNLLGERS